MGICKCKERDKIRKKNCKLIALFTGATYWHFLFVRCSVIYISFHWYLFSLHLSRNYFGIILFCVFKNCLSLPTLSLHSLFLSCFTNHSISVFLLHLTRKVYFKLFKLNRCAAAIADNLHYHNITWIDSRLSI